MIAIDIAHIPYRVAVCTDLLVNSSGEPCDAQIDHAQRVIWVAPGLSKKRREAVLAAAASKARLERMNEILVRG